MSGKVWHNKYSKLSNSLTWSLHVNLQSFILIGYSTSERRPRYSQVGNCATVFTLAMRKIWKDNNSVADCTANDQIPTQSST